MPHQNEHYPHMPRARIQPGGEMHLHQLPQTEVLDIEKQPLQFIALALVHLRNAMTKMPKMLQDYSRPVDEYDTQTLVPEQVSTLALQPQWEVSERIESVIITGPAAGVVTLQLGDRVWPLVIPATGFIVISPISVYLGRDDLRQLIAAVPGNYTLELMGHADTRGNLLLCLHTRCTGTRSSGA